MIRILKFLMPSYNATPGAVRMDVKKSVREYLLNKLGSETKLSSLTKTVYQAGQTFITYVIPQDMYYEFRNWAIKELRMRFGDVLVPIQAWETI